MFFTMVKNDSNSSFLSFTPPWYFIHHNIHSIIILLSSKTNNFNFTFQIPSLHCYSKYCSNQIYAKEVFDRISQKPDVADFLERCRASSFSRKLDLWSFLDTPRRRLPKVLVGPIFRHWPVESLYSVIDFPHYPILWLRIAVFQTEIFSSLFTI